MPKNCSHCNLQFEIEPNFFQGAMYVSYGLQVAIFIAVYISLRLTISPANWVYIVTTIIATIILLPITLRLSRIMYINLFMGYEQKYDKYAA
ncbi:MAG TPA: DUF983 domain-containing protein [Cyclobacteriaceae bacterium]|nr:DUF983 domain-containing protein [Cyclobacteriaceae bacterium]